MGRFVASSCYFRFIKLTLTTATHLLLIAVNSRLCNHGEQDIHRKNAALHVADDADMQSYKQGVERKIINKRFPFRLQRRSLWS